MHVSLYTAVSPTEMLSSVVIGKCELYVEMIVERKDREDDPAAFLANCVILAVLSCLAISLCMVMYECI